jgi:hypothetical protein
VIHHKPFLSKEEVETAVAAPATNSGQLAQSSAYPGIARTAAAVANRCAINPENRTRPPFAHLKRFLKESDGLTPGGGRHH